MYDVVIIGAGVIGGLIARELSRYDLKLCIVEKENDVAAGTTKANSAIVHAGFDAAPGSLKAKFNVLGAQMMPQVAKELDVPYQNNGSLVIGFNEEDEQTLHTLYQRGLDNGVKDLSILDQEALRKLEPNISPNAICALYAPTAGIICPYALTIAAVGNAMDHGAHLKRNFTVTAITQRDDLYTVTSQTGEFLQAKFVVNAAGLYAGHIANMVGDTSFTLHPRRGEYILLDKSFGNLVSHTIFRTPSKMGKGILVSPTVDGNLLTGPTSADITDSEDTQTSPEGFAQVMRESCENVQGLSFGGAITSFCGLRAVSDVGDFIIRSPRAGFVNVAGIESPGLSASPAIARYVVELLSNIGLALQPRKDFNPCRKSPHYFRKLSIPEKNAIIAKDPAYGRILCRCEQVTEGEILYAIRQNPQPLDLDGIKRRTRAQMGRCQGGFCSPHLVELLARELGVSWEQITKKGGNSYILSGKTKEDTHND